VIDEPVDPTCRWHAVPDRVRLLLYLRIDVWRE
jgi:hypothetical protein